MLKTMSIAALGLLLLGSGGGLTAQPTDPALLKAKEETSVVSDLGRMFGYLNTMVKDTKTPALTTEQLKSLQTIVQEILATKRMEPKRASTLLVQIEDKILTPAQLKATDKAAAVKATERTQTQGTGPGASGGTSPLASYVAGGDYNPIRDKTKPMGQDFLLFVDYLNKRLGK